MRSVAYSALLALAGATAASPALAQEYAPFTGPRVEGLVGWDKVQTNPGSDDDIGYGVAAGYDFQFGGAVAGVEAEYMDSDVRSCGGLGTVANPRICAKAARDLYVGGRVGTALSPNVLLYAKAGYTNARFKATSDDGTTETTLGGDNLDGVRVGGGAEYKLGQNSYVKAEYRYSNYEAGLERHQVVGGFGLRF